MQWKGPMYGQFSHTLGYLCSEWWPTSIKMVVVLVFLSRQDDDFPLAGGGDQGCMFLWVVCVVSGGLHQ
jgi:hypothetical protein